MNPYRIIAAVLCMAVLFLGAGILFGAEPLIDAPEKVAPYKFVDAKVVGDFESAIWTVEPEDAVDLRPSADGKTLTWVAPPGVYVIRLVAVNFTAKKIVQGKKSVTIGTPEPEPKPEPKPNPKPPDPQPTPTKPVAIYMIYESGDLTPATARVRDALPWKTAADSLGIKWLAFDDESGEKQFPNATKRARDAGLPALVLIDKAGVPEVLKVPETPEAMEILVKEKGGA